MEDEVQMRSGVSAEIWDLFDKDLPEFKRRVESYFAKAYPGWKVVRASPATRTIWLKDERRKSE